MELKVTNCKDETIKHSNTYLLSAYSGAWKIFPVFQKIMEHIFFKVCFTLSFNMR